MRPFRKRDHKDPSKVRRKVLANYRTKFESQPNEQAAGGAGRAAGAGETRHLAQHFHRSTTCRLADTAAQTAPRQQQFYYRRRRREAQARARPGIDRLAGKPVTF